MKLIRLALLLLLAVLGSICWLIIFNLPMLMFSQLGFCENAAELSKPNPDCPAPWWYWAGNIVVPLILLLATAKRIREISQEDEN